MMMTAPPTTTHKWWELDVRNWTILFVNCALIHGVVNIFEESFSCFLVNQ
jgi:hypothetical protein